jgi:ABC-type branched-subunit amino acid transport system ATPase component
MVARDAYRTIELWTPQVTRLAHIRAVALVRLALEGAPEWKRRLTRTPVEAFRGWLTELGIPKLNLRRYARDLPLATLRVIDLARAMAITPDVLGAVFFVAAKRMRIQELNSMVGMVRGRLGR